MWRPNKKLPLLLVLTLAPSLHAAPPTVGPTLTPTFSISTPPTVTGFTPAGACVAKGSSLTVQGTGFGTASGKGVALGGSGIHVDLPVSSWSSTGIGVTIPNDTRIKGGQWYYIGVEKADHSQWLSNINKTVTICNTAPIATLPLKTPPLVLSPSGGGTKTGSTPTGPASTGIAPTGAAPPPESGYTPEGTPYDSGYAAPAAPAVPSNAGGSLLGAQLPPPPEDTPPAPVKTSNAVEPAELVVVSSNMAEAQQLALAAQRLRLAPKRRNQLAGLGFVVTVFRVPKEMSVGDALLALRQASPNAWADANHRLQLMGDETKTYGQKLIGWNASGNCGAGVRVGMVDTAVDTRHPKLRGGQLQQRSFLTTGSDSGGAEHGTATAGLLIGTEIGLLPGVQLYAANVFRARDGEIDTTAESVVLALNWLMESRVSAINLSLGGPRNLLVEAAVKRVIDSGVAVVAAAGNGGEGAPPVYPAAQTGVVAVTAVDAGLSPYRKATRGDYISFAAPGVDVWTTAPGKDGVYVSGTSYAAPFVTAALIVARQGNQRAAWNPILKQMQARARDLGAPGKDPNFGWGLIQTSGCGKAVAAKSATGSAR